MIACFLAGGERKMKGSSFFKESSDTCGEVICSDSNSKEYVVCKFQIRMQIQIQNVNLSTNSNSKNTRNLQKGTPVDFCSENQVAHFFVVKTEWLTFFNLCWSSSIAGSVKVEKNQGLLSSLHSCNKR